MIQEVPRPGGVGEGVLTPEIYVQDYSVERRGEEKLGSPLSYSRLNEFLECPGCFNVRQEKRFRVPETEEMVIGTILHDLVAYSHSPVNEERIKFRSPRTLLNFMQYFYPERLRTLRDGKKVIGFLEERKGGELKDEELGQFVMETASEAMVRYYLLNYWAIIESQERSIDFSLNSSEGKMPMTARIDQFRQRPIGELKRGTKGRRRTLERQIFELKSSVGQDRLDLSLQTGIQLLAYRAKYPHREPPEIVIYDLATGRKFLRRGGDERYLVAGLVCAKRAMELGFDEPNQSDPFHKHYPQLRSQPKLHTGALAGFEGIMSRGEGRKWYEAAKVAFEAYNQSCEWEEVPALVSVKKLAKGDFRMELLNEVCFDCGRNLMANLDDWTYCPEHGRVGKIKREWKRRI
jgi:hypothetical protein